MTAALEFKDAVKCYRRRRALDGLSFVVPRGCVMGLVGSNGAGKTTALTVSAGLIRLRSGIATLFGEGPFKAARHAGRISLLPQDALMPGHLTARQFLTYLGRLQGLPRRAAFHEAEAMLDWVHLADRRDARIQTLSHGMRRRLTIAQSFLGAPELVLLDEPLNGLDPREVSNIRNLIRRKRPDQTLVISSHLLNEVETGCDEVVFMEKGRCVRQDRLDRLTGRDQSVRVLLGEVPADLARIEQGMAGYSILFDIPTRTLTATAASAPADAASLNTRLLRILLDEKLPILEVLRGTGLEAEYLRENRTDRPGSATGQAPGSGRS